MWAVQGEIEMATLNAVYPMDIETLGVNMALRYLRKTL